MDRRSFLVRFGGAVVAVPAALKLTACGDDGGGGDTPDAGGGGGETFTITNTGEGTNHSHSATVDCSDLDSSGGASFTASGSGHTHEVQLTEQELMRVAGGETVTVQTTDGGHPHTWEVSAGNQCS